MISNFSHDGPLLSEAKRTVQVSQHKSFIADLKNYAGDSEVSLEIHTVTELFKERDYSELRDTYNDHELTDNLKGYSSVNLFYGTQKDVVIVYKKQKNGHIVFHRIGNHEKVYDPDYQKMDKNRQMKKKKMKDWPDYPIDPEYWKKELPDKKNIARVMGGTHDQYFKQMKEIGEKKLFKILRKKHGSADLGNGQKMHDYYPITAEDIRKYG